MLKRTMVNVALTSTSPHCRAGSTRSNTILLNVQQSVFIGLSKLGVKVSPHFPRGAMEDLGAWRLGCGSKGHCWAATPNHIIGAGETGGLEIWEELSGVRRAEM